MRSRCPTSSPPTRRPPTPTAPPRPIPPPPGVVPSDDAPAGRASRWRSALVTHPLRVILVAGVVGSVALATTALREWFHRGFRSSRRHKDRRRRARGAGCLPQSTAGDCLQWGEASPVRRPRSSAANPIGSRWRLRSTADRPQWRVRPGCEVARPEVLRHPLEQCPVLVAGYLDGRFDPQGRFVPSLIYPSEAQWKRGQRDMRCGLIEQGSAAPRWRSSAGSPSSTSHSNGNRERASASTR